MSPDQPGSSSSTATHRGLTEAEANRRLAVHGPNSVPDDGAEPVWRRLARQFRSPLIYILLVALAVDLIAWWAAGSREWPFEAGAIAAILLMNAALGVWQEQRAERSLARLRELAAPLAWVYRDGRLTQRPAASLVVGDLVRLGEGDRVPADGLIRSDDALQLDESVLTGESLPVDRGPEEELLAGTLVTRGRADIEITRTGVECAAGRLAALLARVPTEPTPLGRRLGVFGHRVARWILGLSLLLVIMGLAAEGFAEFPSVFLFAVALAVAAVPEGLPAVLTVTLALGVERMARRQAVVRRLDAVEALGSVTVIATDKTGTLTENQLEVRDIDSPERDRAIEAMAIANDADLESGAGDPLDTALLRYAAPWLADRGYRIPSRISSRPFDPNRKYMRVTVESDGAVISYLKGAPEVLLARSTLAAEQRSSWIQKVEAYASSGMRLVALASAPGEEESDLQWLGVALLWDPPRPEVPRAVAQARLAGIRVLMITGDHPGTALGVAEHVGIEGELVTTGLEIAEASDDRLADIVSRVSVFARVTPEHKLRIVEALKRLGEVVAVTGDGVNDAPALKRADVGVAMGLRGSAVSREAADIVLLDDNFATIVGAVAEGRNIYRNIQAFLRFLFSTNLSEVVVVVLGMAAAMLLSLRDATGALVLPLTAAQLLWVNLVTDGFPAMALGLDRTPGVLGEQPRDPASPLLDTSSLRFVVLTGLAKGMLALALLWLLPLWGEDHTTTRTAVFVFLAAGQLLLAYPSRMAGQRPLANKALHFAVVGGILLQLLVVYLAPLAIALETVELAPSVWLLVLASMTIAWGVAQTVASRVWRNGKTSGKLEPERASPN